MSLAFSSAGDPNNTPVILLHAFPLNHQMWRHQLEGLSESAYVLAPDLPGFGESPLSETPGSMSDYVKQIITFMGEQKIEQAVLGGCSMGGYILFEFWRTMPRRILGLILYDTRAEADSGEQINNRLKMAETVRNEGVGMLVKDMPEKLLGKTTQTNNKEMVREIENTIKTTPPEGVVQAQVAMASRPGSLVTLESIIAPTLIIVGEEDILTPPSAAETMHQKIPTSELVLIKKAGHLSPLEQPGPVNLAMHNFLQSTCA
ncbi:MAG: alpha/beta hydrolase [Candidatus Hinthialibacter antarcticus]|nr:alpha/beta hydrolase [Candidatus Hinthialibacter antarcticus]